MGTNSCFANEMNNKYLYSVKEAADFLHVSEQYVRGLIRNGRLPADSIGRSWVIPFDSLGLYQSKTELVDSSVCNHARRSPVSKGIKALSFFSGAMGMDIGLEQAGIEILLTCETDKACRETITANKPNIALIGDIREYSASQTRKTAGLSDHDEIDLVIGGPPCQAFSSAGKRLGFDDERGNAFLTFIDRIVELRPRYAVIENVRGLLSAPLKHRPHAYRGPGFPPLTSDERPGGVLKLVLVMLRSAGYGISFNLYNAANYGTPQKRERVIIVCNRDGEVLPFLPPTHSESGLFGLPGWKTFKEAVAGLPDDSHDHVEFPERRLRFYRMLKPGQYWRNLPPEVHEEALGASYLAGGGKTGFYRRLAWDKPSPALVTHPAMPATDLAHPVENRPLSVQEYKRLQEFPHEWVIKGSIIEQYRQIGNAVPCGLGKAVGELIVSHIRGKEIRILPDFPYSRYKYADHISWEERFNHIHNESAGRQLALAID